MGIRETGVQSLGQEDLEKEMVTHSSTLAWKVPWMEKPGRLQSMGSQRAGHNRVTSLSFFLSDGKETSCSAGDLGSIPGSVRSSGVGNGYPLQYSCLENSVDRGAWWATIHGVPKSWTRLSD